LTLTPIHAILTQVMKEEKQWTVELLAQAAHAQETALAEKDAAMAREEEVS